jgi:hypothetical protein
MNVLLIKNNHRTKTMPYITDITALAILHCSEKYMGNFLELYKDSNPFLYATFLKLIKDIPEEIKSFDKKNNTGCFDVFNSKATELKNVIHSCNNLSGDVSELLEIIDQYCYEEVEINNLRFKIQIKNVVEYLIREPIMYV